MVKRFVSFVGSATLLLSLAGGAHAAPAYCAANTDGMALSDVTFSGNTPTTSADDCYGHVSFSPQTNATLLNGLAWGPGWSFLVADNMGSSGTASGSFGGIDYTLDSGLAGTSGSWTLGASPLDSLPVYVDFVVALRKGNDFGLYFFDDVVISGSNNGSWTSTFLTGQSLANPNDLALFVRTGSNPNPQEPPAQIPEPAGIALVGLALAAAGLARRRTRQG
jgi:hypothetical protein